MKKKWILSSIIVIALIYGLYAYHRPNYVELSFNSMIFSMDSDFEQSTIVSMKGDHYRSLLGNGMLLGELSVDEDLKYNVKLTKGRKSYEDIITTWDSNKNTIIIGYVEVSHELDKVWIQLDDINERYSLSEGHVAGPASASIEAKQISSKIVDGIK